MSWPTAITLLRVLVIPPFLYSMASTPQTPGDAGPLPAILLFVFGALTDFADGYLARRLGRVTPAGQVLDPLADKLLVGAALVALTAYRHFPLWATAVILVREVAISVLRSALARRGKPMPADLAGKIKTALQIPMVVVWLLPRADATAVAQDVSVYLVVAATVFSGVRYLVRSRERLATQ